MSRGRTTKPPRASAADLQTEDSDPMALYVRGIRPEVFLPQLWQEFETQCSFSGSRWRELEDALGTRVRIVEKTDQRGRIEIEYYSQEDLQRLYGLIVEATKN